MLLNRRFFIAFLALVLLIRSAAGFAMQIDMAYGMIQTNTAATQLVPSCHEGMPAMGASTSMNMDDSNGASATDSSACSLCCIAVAFTSTVVFHFLPIQSPAPTAVLFNSLPAAEQRPTKPPLV